MRLSRGIPACVVACILMLLAACSQPPQWQLADVKGHLPDLQFDLTSDTGKAVTAADYNGKINLLFFGYTHCPDVCPLTLTHLHVVMQRLGTQAEGAHIIFVSVDPTRDTPAVLHQYVTAFDPRMTGLSGTPKQIESLAKRYRVAFNREKAQTDGSYDVSHSSGVYIFDREGHARLLATNADSIDAIVHDVQILLGSSS